MRIPDLPWLLRKMEQDEALDKLEDAVDARNEALKALLIAESELQLQMRLKSLLSTFGMN